MTLSLILNWKTVYIKMLQKRRQIRYMLCKLLKDFSYNLHNTKNDPKLVPNNSKYKKI